MKTLISNQNPITTVKISLTKEEKRTAKKFAKNHGYTFQWWLGSLVKEELKKNIESP